MKNRKKLNKRMTSTSSSHVRFVITVVPNGQNEVKRKSRDAIPKTLKKWKNRSLQAARIRSAQGVSSRVRGKSALQDVRFVLQQTEQVERHHIRRHRHLELRDPRDERLPVQERTCPMRGYTEDYTRADRIHHFFQRVSRRKTQHIRNERTVPLEMHYVLQDPLHLYLHHMRSMLHWENDEEERDRLHRIRRKDPESKENFVFTHDFDSKINKLLRLWSRNQYW